MMQGSKIVKFLTGFGIVVFILGVFLICGKIERTYTTKGVVLRNEKGIVIVEDSVGEVWEYEGKGKEGQEVKLWFDDNGTKEREDDKIIKIKVI